MATDIRDVDDLDDGGAAERYAALQVEDAAMVIYDQENHRAWVQSNLAVGLEDMA